MFTPLSLVVLALNLVAVTSDCTQRDSATTDTSFTGFATCVFQYGAEGAVFLREGSAGLEVRAYVSGMMITNGNHGFHIHEYGSLFMADKDAGMCAATGGHFNPASVDHGNYDAGTRHAGDFGNLCVKDGKGMEVFVDSEATLTGADSVVGLAIVIHADEDDFGQPTGNAGGRLACCVISHSAEWTEDDVGMGYSSTGVVRASVVIMVVVAIRAVMV